MSPRALFVPFLVSALALAGCGPTDDDGDGWYGEAVNQRVTLMVTGVSAGPLAPAVIVDDRIVFEAGLATPATTPVQTRTLGAWANDPAEGAVTFASVLRVDGVVQTVEWRNEDSDFDVTVGLRTVSLRTRIERFADPNPNDAGADADADAIPEAAEAQLAEAAGGRVGDPAARDLVVAVAFVHPTHVLSDRARQAVSTVFRNRDINLLFVDGTYPVAGFSPGQFLFEGTKLAAPNAAPYLSDTTPERGAHIPAWADGFARFLVMANRAARFDGNGDEELLYGLANLPGHNLIVGSALGPLGADGLDYQAKTVMHELGHNLGLCHPLDTRAICPVLPAADQDPAVSVMGSPVEAPNLLLQATQALARPLDYTEAQWQALKF